VLSATEYVKAIIDRLRRRVSGEDVLCPRADDEPGIVTNSRAGFDRIRVTVEFEAKPPFVPGAGLSRSLLNAGERRLG